MLAPSHTHLVLIPSFNPGTLVVDTVRQARARWNPVWVVSDGSTDGTPEVLATLAAADTGFRVLALPHNGGKGAAVLAGLEQAIAAGYTHVLTMDADGQHPAALIPDFMTASREHPDAMILGVPVFDDQAPALRVQGRRISNAFAQLETLWTGIGDSLFGFRVYPITPLRRIMLRQRWMRRFDFDPEAAVRLRWQGVPAINRAAPVRYPSRAEGGISHFHYLRDNGVLIWMHTRLLLGWLLRLPWLLYRRFHGRP